jgi:NAD(P)-dependent dehydrogenase (short-subunit alcohol dehydrogenase family)
MRPLDQQVILVTGATDGLGREVATRLAAGGATVLVHGRDDRRGAATLDAIRGATGNDRARWYRADLASLAEVRALAERVAADHPRLDVLVNNAGIGFTTPGVTGREVAGDGHELRFQVNYLAPYLLTRLLLPTLLASASARVVNVASAGQLALDRGDLMTTRGYDGATAYRRSKLALVMFTMDLADELAGTGVTATSLHPGTFMPTKMVVEAGATPIDTLESGVEATMALVAGPEADGASGAYVHGRRRARPDPQAADESVRRWLRAESDRLVGLVPHD